MSRGRRERRADGARSTAGVARLPHAAGRGQAIGDAATSCPWSWSPATVNPCRRRDPASSSHSSSRPRRAASPLVRSYSLSGSPSDASYRIGVKVEPHGAAGQYIRNDVRVGDQLEVGAPRGSFILDDGERPVVLASAGVGVTPMLAMLHALHDRRSTREIWWLHGARNRSEHAFAEEAASLLDDLVHVHRRIWYSRPDPTDRAGTDYDAVGRVTPEALEAAGRAHRRRVLPLRTDRVHGHPARRASPHSGFRADACTRRSSAHRSRSRPGVVAGPTRPPHQPEGAPGYRTARLVRALRAQRALGRRAAPASSSWPRPATCRCDGRVAPASATPARPVSSTERSSTSPSHSRRPPRATCSCAARDPTPISRSICDHVADAELAVVEDLGPEAAAVHQRGAHAGHVR